MSTNSRPSSGRNAEPDDATWLASLDMADDEREVMRICRNFLATLDPAEIGKLPETCRPREIGNAADLCAIAYELVRHNCDDGTFASAIGSRLATVFARANVRVAQIYRRMNDRGLRELWRVR